MKELRTELETKRKELPSRKKAVETTEADVDTKLTETADRVVDDLRTSGIRRYQARNIYTVRQVRELLDGDASIFDEATQDLPADRQRATSPVMPAITIQSRAALLEQDGLDTARRLLAESIVNNQTIDQLDGRSDRSKWVQL